MEKELVTNINKIKARIKINYGEVAENMLQCFSVTYTIKYLIKELIQLQNIY